MSDFNENQIKEMYIAGLLHDIGKYIHKCNGNKASHQILSQMFILNNPDICLGNDVNKIANIVANHHMNPNVPGEGVLISPFQSVTADLLKKASDNFKITSYNEEINILKKADSMSASSDRASEIEGERGTSSPYAPLISPIGRVFNKRLALKHGREYEVYEFTGTTDTKDVVENLDKNCTKHIENSFNAFMADIQTVKYINGLNDVLKLYWSTVNANTWRPAGESLGNTTTSLYDHSKTTAAIAVCIYINKQLKKGADTDIDIIHLIYNGMNNSLKDLSEKILSKYSLNKVNIISCTDNEAYIMIPDSLREDFKIDLKELNAKLFTECGDLIDYELGTQWKFKDCRETFKSRFNDRHYGILDIIGKAQPEVNTESENNLNNQLKNKFIGGYSIEGFDYIIGKILNDNDSISKVSTTFRIFEYFNDEVEKLLILNGCTVIRSELSLCVYSADNIEHIHKMEKHIQFMFDKFVKGVTGLYFTYMKFDKYKGTLKAIENELETRRINLNVEEKIKGKGLYSTILINGSRYKMGALNKYNDYIKIINGIDKSFLFNVKEHLEDLLLYDTDKDSSHLISISRLNYLMNQAKEEDKKAFIRDVCDIANLYKADIDKLNTNTYILYEALKTSLTNVK